MQWVDTFSSIPQLHVSVNFSPKNFSDQKIVEYILQVLKETKLPPESLWIEITEDMGLDINETALDILNQLQEMGISRDRMSF